MVRSIHRWCATLRSNVLIGLIALVGLMGLTSQAVAQVPPPPPPTPPLTPTCVVNGGTVQGCLNATMQWRWMDLNNDVAYYLPGGAAGLEAARQFVLANTPNCGFFGPCNQGIADAPVTIPPGDICNGDICSGKYSGYAPSPSSAAVPEYDVVLWGILPAGSPPFPSNPATYTSQTEEMFDVPQCPVGYGPDQETDGSGATVYMCQPLTQTSVGPGGDDSTKQGCIYGCNPVLLATGDKNDYAEDYRNGSPYPIVIARTYTSTAQNWVFNFQRGLSFSKNPTTATAYAVLNRADGSVITFSASLPSFTTSSYAWSSANGVNQTVLSTLTDTKDNLGQVTGFDVKNLNDENEHYDAQGHLASITDRAGNVLTYTRDAQGRVGTIADSAGRSVTLTYPDPSTLPFGAGALLLSLPITISDGTQTVTYTYNTTPGMTPVGVLTDVVYPDSAHRTYAYNGTLLTGITDENRQTYAAYTYTGRQVASSVHGNNLSTINYSYNTFNHQTTVTDGVGRSSVVTTANAATQIMKMTGTTTPCTACAGTGAYGSAASYDTLGNQTSLTDFNGNQTTSTYDLARGLPLTVNEAVGTPNARTTTITYAPGFRLPASITQAVEVYGAIGTRVTAFTYDTHGNALTKTVTVTPPHGTPVVRTWTSTYNAAGQVLTAQSPRTDVNATTTYTYDTSNNLTSMTDPLGHTTTYSNYTPEGLVGTMTDPNGLVTSITYDARQRPTQIARGSSATHQETWTLAYAPTGLLSSVTRPDGSSVVYVHDQAHRLTEIDELDETGATHGRKVFTLDASDAITQTQVYDASGAVVKTASSTYDANARLHTAVGALTAQTTTLGHDTQGNLTQTTDANGNVTTAGYDTLNRLTRVTDALLGNANTTYDPADNVVQVKDKDLNTTTYQHDGFDDVTQTLSPDSGTTTKTYDLNGNVLSAVDARGTVARFTYDAMDRPTQATFAHTASGPVTETQTFTYDTCLHGIGRLCAFSDASGSTAYTYDLWGRVASKAQTVGSTGSGGSAHTLTVQYAYDTSGRLITQTYPSAQVVNRTYLNHRPVSISLGAGVSPTTLLSGATYEPFGGDHRGWTWGDSTTVAYGYDQNLWTNAITDVDSKAYTRDNDGNVTAITDSGTPSTSLGYGYDALTRVASNVVGTAPSATTYGYVYDANDNRTSLTQSQAQPIAFTIDPSSNKVTKTQVLGTTGLNVVTDAAGNITNDGVNAFTYDDKGRMASSTNSASLITIYQVNALGQRVSKTNSGGTTYFVYDEQGVLMGTYDVSGSATEELVYLEGRPVATVRGATIYRILTDHLQTPRKLIDASNATVWSWDGHEAFGKTGPTGSITFNLRFPGQYADVETGLFNNGFRDYAPAWGRYVESDPTGLSGGLNTYGYVGDNSVNFIDKAGNLKTDASGNLIFNPISVDYVTYNIGQNKTATVQSLKGDLFADDGAPIVAYKNLTDQHRFDYDCHGLSFAGKKFWINNDQVLQLLKDDGYKSLTDLGIQPIPGDVVVYYDSDGNVVHSGLIVQGNMVYNKGGTQPNPTLNVITPGPNGAWSGNGTTYFVYRK